MNDPDRPNKLNSEIEKNLKRTYEKVASEEVPDRFTDLLAQLRAAEANQGKSNEQ